jgi:hypothetical protein
MAPAFSNVPFGNYRHVGELIYFDADKKMRRNEPEHHIGLDWVDIPLFDFWSNIEDHFNRNYIAVLLTQDLKTQCTN